MVSEGNISDTDSVIVTVNPLPTANAGNDVTIEAGDSVNLSATGGTNYLWSNGSTDQNISVSPMETSTYMVTVYKNGCSSEDSITVTVVEPVDADAGEDVEICLGESVTLTASGGSEYQWSTGETTERIEVTPTRRNTVYRVRVSNGISFVNDNVTVTANDCEEPVESLTNFNPSIRVYPNPAQSQVNVKIMGLDGIASLQLFDMSGRVLINKAVQPTASSPLKNTLNVGSLPRGMYLVTVSHNGKSYTKQLILN